MGSMRSFGRESVRRVTAVGVLAAWLLAWFFVADAFAATAGGSDVGKNIGNLLKGYAGEVYGGIVAVISLVFLLNRRYTELAVFLVAAIVVAWMVFAPGEIASAAEGIGKQIFG